MSGALAIQVEGLGKKYRIGAAQRERYVALRDVLTNAARRALRPRPAQTAAPEAAASEFWALRDVNFEVRHGEVLGVIGRNGAGKSTLLKILSRITEPTEGRVRVGGRVASLLEVGTGFHPELTGRENIFLNGAVMGMSRAEIRRKFDEIVAFSEVERFLDTPVKRYSSGMYVRLAFAVAAHLEPEILIVDEVLAVGDAEFQKKCLGKMSDAARSDRTVLFVSHNLNAVERLCQRVLVLEAGRVLVLQNDVRAGVAAYLQSVGGGGLAVWSREDGRFDHPAFRVDRIQVSSAMPGARPDEPLPNSHPIRATIEGEVRTTDPAFNVGLALFADDGQLLFWSFMRDADEVQGGMACGVTEFTATIPPRILNEGRYRLEAIPSFHSRGWILAPGQAPSVEFEIRGGLSDSPLWDQRRPGLIAPVLRWEIEQKTALAGLGRSGEPLRA